MLKIQEDIIRIAQASQQANHEEYFTRFSEEQTLFPVNSYVLVNYGDQKAPSKLHSHWRGPYRVVAIDEEDPNRYTVQNLVTNKLVDFGIHRLKPFLSNDVNLPEDIALTDDPKSHTIERILSHEGNRYKPSTLKFLVKWADQTEQERSLELYNTIKNNLALHEYLTTLGED